MTKKRSCFSNRLKTT